MIVSQVVVTYVKCKHPIRTVIKTFFHIPNAFCGNSGNKITLNCGNIRVSKFAKKNRYIEAIKFITNMEAELKV